MWRIGCTAALVLIVGIPIVASRYLPWWGTLLVIIGEIVGLRFLIPRLFALGIKRVFLGMFVTKSRVPQGAMVHVHAVELKQPQADRQTIIEPAGENLLAQREPEDADDVDAGKRLVQIEFTLTPKPRTSRMTHWEPAELLLVPFDSEIDMREDPTSNDAVAGQVKAVSLIGESGEEIDEFDKITGKARLRMIFACPSTLSGRVKFRYYFETFGDVMLP